MKKIIILLLFTIASFGQQKAFDTAIGAGAYATGGRGGQVIHVTTLDWDAAGGLKEAIQTQGARTIVFDVSGTIDASSQGYFETLISGSNYDNLTIAGQTAPEGGITILTSYFIITEVDNIIMRYIRFRNYEVPDTAYFQSSDAIWFQGCNNVILDHVTASHANDEAIDFSASATPTSSNNITIQNSFIQDSKTGVLMGDDDASGGFTFANNVVTGVSHRFPNTTGTSTAQFDIVNNVIYNHKNRLTRVTKEGNINVLNNYYKPASEGLKREGWFTGDISDHWLQKLQAQLTDDPLIYTAGNIIVGQREVPLTDDSDMWTYFAGSDASFPEHNAVASNFFTSTMFPLTGESFTIKTAVESYEGNLNNTGANKTLNADGSVNFFMDSKDASDITMIKDDTFQSYEDNNFTYVPRSEIAYPTVSENTRPVDFYVSNSHIPEVWFAANVPSGEDHNDIAPSGYTWLEEYLNSVDSTKEVVYSYATISKKSKIILISN